MNFSQFEFQTNLLKGIAALGFEQPTPIQAITIPLLLQGRDVIGCAQTGTGKTAAYALPILEKIQSGSRKPQALIVEFTGCPQHRSLIKEMAAFVFDVITHGRERNINGGQLPPASSSLKNLEV